MKHLEDEDFGRLIDGNINREEREIFLKHLSECGECLSVYSQTLKFIEDEKKSRSLFKIPSFEITVLSRFWEDVRRFFTVKKYRLAYACAILVLIIAIPFILDYFSNARVEQAQVQYIEESLSGIDISNIPAFNGSTDPVYAAVRAGIFFEDFSGTIKAGNNIELREKIGTILTRQLKIMIGENHPLPPELQNIDKSNVVTLSKSIYALLSHYGRSDLFEFGRFIEQGIFLSLENKPVKQSDVEKFKVLVSDISNKSLPPGVLNDLNKLKSNITVEQSKEILEDLKEIFLSIE